MPPAIIVYLGSLVLIFFLVCSCWMAARKRVRDRSEAEKRALRREARSHE